MVLVIPSIELSEGRCTRLICGEEGTEDFYKCLSEDPLALCHFWRRENAKSLHLFDYDSYNGLNNYLNINSILYIINQLDIPIQLSSDFSDTSECKLYLDNGVYRIFISELALMDPIGVSELIKEYTPSRVCFQAFTDNRYIFFPNTQQQLKDIEFAKFIKNLGGNRIAYNTLNNSQEKPPFDFNYLIKFAMDSGLKITISDGIYNSKDLLECPNVLKYGIDSVILGEELHNNSFPCQKIWRIIEAEVEQDKAFDYL